MAASTGGRFFGEDADDEAMLPDVVLAEGDEFGDADPAEAKPAKEPRIKTGLSHVIPSKREATLAFSLTAGLAAAGTYFGIGPALGAMAGLSIYSGLKSLCVMRRLGKSDNPFLQRHFGSFGKLVRNTTFTTITAAIVAGTGLVGLQKLVDSADVAENNLRRYAANKLVNGGLFPTKEITIPKSGEKLSSVKLRFEERESPEKSFWVYSGEYPQSLFAYKTGTVSIKIPTTKVAFDAKFGGIVSKDKKFFERQLAAIPDYEPATGMAKIKGAFITGYDKWQGVSQKMFSWSSNSTLGMK